jgi:murein L,D-transpeptidase YcbB/YkuD
LEEAFASGQEQPVTLRRPVAVYLVYLTAWAGEDGAVHFRPDLYGRDDMLAALLPQAAAPS